MEPVYRETVRRWMKWIVSAKSGTSLEREIKKRIDITPIKEFNSQTSPNIHPTVVSPLRLRQLSTRSKLKCFPATSAVKSINAVAAVYHIACNMTI